MKKIAVAVGLSVLVVGVAGVVLFRNFTAEEASASSISSKAAETLQSKIDAIKKAHETNERRPGSDRLELSEVELESYVLYSMKEDLPIQLDSIDVELQPGAIASEAQITFNSNATGNPLLDSFVGGTHNLGLKGRLFGERGRGKFDLDEVRVDGIPVPMILVQTLVEKYVKPKYPAADLKEPFDLPWGIQELKLEQEKASVVY